MRRNCSVQILIVSIIMEENFDFDYTFKELIELFPLIYCYNYFCHTIPKFLWKQQKKNSFLQKNWFFFTGVKKYFFFTIVKKSTILIHFGHSIEDNLEVYYSFLKNRWYFFSLWWSKFFGKQQKNSSLFQKNNHFFYRCKKNIFFHNCKKNDQKIEIFLQL